MIVWREAAIALIVEREGIGIAISSLRELPARLATVTPGQYAAMRQRVLGVAGRLGRGCYFLEAVEEAARQLISR